MYVPVIAKETAKQSNCQSRMFNILPTLPKKRLSIVFERRQKIFVTASGQSERDNLWVNVRSYAQPTKFRHCEPALAGVAIHSVSCQRQLFLLDRRVGGKVPSLEIPSCSCLSFVRALPATHYGICSPSFDAGRELHRNSFLSLTRPEFRLRILLRNDEYILHCVQ